MRTGKLHRPIAQNKKKTRTHAVLICMCSSRSLEQTDNQRVSAPNPAGGSAKAARAPGRAAGVGPHAPAWLDGKRPLTGFLSHAGAARARQAMESWSGRQLGLKPNSHRGAHACMGRHARHRSAFTTTKTTSLQTNMENGFKRRGHLVSKQQAHVCRSEQCVQENSFATTVKHPAPSCLT
jgi:hypothetical protein